MAAALGRPCLPWQSYVNAVAGEFDPATGRMCYPLVVLSVPRRAGKTVDVLATGLQRIRRAPMSRAWYTAQTQTAAADQFVKEWLPLVEHSPIAAAYRILRGNGKQSIAELRTASTFGVFAPTETALHGQSADVGFIDEAWAHDIPAGEAIEAGLGPAMATRPSPQIWVLSAGGTLDSHYWDRTLTRAEEWCQLGGLDGVALFDFGAGVDDPVDDPAVWAASHPAVGLTIDRLFLAGELTARGPVYFDRHYLNRWARPSAATAVGAIDAAAWSAAFDPTAELVGPITLAYDVSPDRRRAAVAAAATSSTDPDRVLVTIVRHATGTSWLADALAGHDGPIVADNLAGATAAAALDAAGGPVVDLIGPSDLARATANLVDVVEAGRFHHHGQAPLDDALSGAVRRPMGDAWYWSRSRSTVDITPLVAVTLAAWAHSTKNWLAPSIY